MGMVCSYQQVLGFTMRGVEKERTRQDMRSHFCGFYVAKADTKLYNQASQVIIARDSDRTILTMANDYQGDVKDFALVVPVPVVLEQEQVQVGNPKIIERLDGFSAPRLVEYFDPNPCMPPAPRELRRLSGGVRAADDYSSNRADSALGVTVESRFSVLRMHLLPHLPDVPRSRRYNPIVPV